MPRKKSTEQIAQTAKEITKKAIDKKVTSRTSYAEQIDAYIKETSKQASKIAELEHSLEQVQHEKAKFKDVNKKQADVIQEYRNLITNFVNDWKALERRAWLRKIFLVIDFVKAFVDKVERTEIVINEKTKNL